MKSNYIPNSKNVEKLTLTEKFNRFVAFSFYIYKVKVQFDAQVSSVYRFGCTYYPQYKQFEFNFGKYLLNFWYRN